jgi:hypothetical protein
MESTTCRNCGMRHQLTSRQNRICRGTVKILDWQHSAAGIAELAAEARAEGIARTTEAALATPNGPRQARHLALAEAAFAKAYELEA